MRIQILPVLSGALLLSACGDKVVGEDLPACEQSTRLSDFKLPQPLAGLEVRRFNPSETSDPRGYAARVIGDSCSGSSCATEVAELDARRMGWSVQTGQLAFTEYIIGMNDTSVVGSATTDAELVQLIGPIDTLAEATLVAELKSMACVRAGEKDGSFQVVDKQFTSICAPIVTQEVLFRVDADASVHELDRADEKKESDACIGRRPAGLAARPRVAQSSAMGDFLARSAELEAASVVAFRVLETELSAHGAPSELIERIREAARDEVIHAQLVQHLAERYGGQVTERTVAVSPVRDLTAIALENSLEGCVSETWGCLIGMHQATHAQDPLLRRVYQRIAADEARHAQLSWDIAEWVEEKLDVAARAQIAERRAEAVQKLAAALSSESDPESTRELLGLPDAATARQLFTHVNQALWS
ncbi:MAG TPA: ferritin-like domain-containing protein [Polyangiaceae bacterium]|nr:ferritin-like domain-containing protein [Polyangiaceae bacterium]